jgi:hypothetical protein
MYEEMQIDGLRYVLETSINEITVLQNRIEILEARIRELEGLLEQNAA